MSGKGPSKGNASWRAKSSSESKTSSIKACEDCDSRGEALQKILEHAADKNEQLEEAEKERSRHLAEKKKRDEKKAISKKEEKKDEDKAISKKHEEKLMSKKRSSSARLMLFASATAEDLKKYQKDWKWMTERNVIPPFLADEPARPRAKARPMTTSSPATMSTSRATPEARTVPIEPVDLAADAGGEEDANAYDGAEVNVEVDEVEEAEAEAPEEEGEEGEANDDEEEWGDWRNRPQSCQSSYGKSRGKGKGRGKYKGKNKSKSKSGKGYYHYNRCDDRCDRGGTAPWKRWW